MSGFRCKLFPTFYETPDVTTPAGAVTPEVPAVEAPAPQPGPWAADLTAYFGDNPEAIAAADRYMREKVQPRMTELEEGSAPARELYKDLLDNPQETLQAVMSEVYGEEQADRFAGLFTEEEAAEVAEAVAEDGEVPAWAQPLLESHQAARDAELRQQGEEQYAQVLAEMREAHNDLTEADLELIHPFMHAAGGDPEVAYAGYQTFKQQFAALHGGPPAPEPAAPELPPVLGSEGGVAATPPIQKTYASINEAMDDWFAERKAGDPPPVI